MQNIPENIIERVRKLLRLSESTNENEAQLALAAAQRYANEYALDLACLATGEEEKQEEYVKEDIATGTSRRSVTHNYVCWILQNHFNVKVLNSGQTRFFGVQIHLIGQKTDVEIAKYVYGYLTHTFMELWRDYKAKNNTPTTLRDSFLYGCYNGLNKKLADSKENDKKEKFDGVERILGADSRNQAESKYALMVIKKKDGLENAVCSFFPKLRKGGSRGYRNHNSSVFNDGVSSGSRISLNKAIGGTQKQLTY